MGTRSPILVKAFIKSEFSCELRGIGSFAFRDLHFGAAVLYVLSPIEFKQYFFPPMDASIAVFSVHLSTGSTAGKIFVVDFSVADIDVGVGVVVVGLNVLAEDVSEIWLIRFAIFCVN